MKKQNRTAGKFATGNGVEIPITNVENSDRALIHKKFVTWQMLLLVFAGSVLFLAFCFTVIKTMPLYFIVIIEFFSFFLIWHRLYQTLYDLKLMFFFSDEYDIKVDFLTETERPVITFIIPSYNEPFGVAKMTFDSIVNAPYSGKKEIIVVDNSKDVRTDDFSNWKNYVEGFESNYPGKHIKAKFLYNDEKGKLKPGNLDLAQRSIEAGELVVILDVDSTLPAEGDLLERAVSEFQADSRLGSIQFLLKATNSHFNSLTAAIAPSQNLMRLRMISRGYGGYKIFEGHNGMLRRKVLNEVDDWTEYYKGNVIISEDILKSTKLYEKGYYGKSLNIETGEWIPSSLNSLESMWMRWMYGNSQVFFRSFKEIYSKNISLIEKFDVSYHILHHVVTFLFFVLAFLIQLFVPGHAGNLFIVFTYILPQLIASVTSYFTFGQNNLSMWDKVKNIYAGFFLIDTFIMSTHIKSEINFMLGVPQGWKVTEKGIESAMRWRDFIFNRSFHFGLAAMSVAVCICSWYINYDLNMKSLIYQIGLLFLSAQLIICVFRFRTDGRKAHNHIESQPSKECEKDNMSKTRKSLVREMENNVDIRTEMIS